MYISASAPEAPPLSETTIGCFIRLFFWMAACIMRAIWSDAPPAPAATTISTDLLGSHAIAGAFARAIAATAVPAATNFFIMDILPCWLAAAPAPGPLCLYWLGTILRVLGLSASRRRLNLLAFPAHDCGALRHSLHFSVGNV